MEPEQSPISPFISPFSHSRSNSLAILHLSRDQQVPIQLFDQQNKESQSLELSSDQAERANITNTRFGSFPHSTLVDVPWGTQVLASKVDTGSWGKRGRKRKHDDALPTPSDSSAPACTDGAPLSHAQDQPAWQKGERHPRQHVAADSGFAHLVPPTPEVWTRALRHRTQVVYTPDYSYILERLRVRPGDRIIEAGAGSGSFTHAATRAVFNGYPSLQVLESNQEKKDVVMTDAEQTDVQQKEEGARKLKRYGKVYSFEFHEPRFVSLGKDIKDHGLQSIVHLTHRDVYEDGFCVEDALELTAPSANAIFLDLPAPWLALKHLIREPANPKIPQPTKDAPEDSNSNDTQSTNKQTEPQRPFRSPLDPHTTTRICTFSPCIEQAQRTITTMRSLGWVEIDMVEIMHKRLEIRRERVGLQEEGLRGVNPSPASVDEALRRLQEIDGRQKAFHEQQATDAQGGGGVGKGDDAKTGALGSISKAERLRMIKEAEGKRKLYKEGRLVHRTEPELKTHTSYLVFAVLPRLWTKEDEEACRRRWPVTAENMVVESKKKKG
ncbi:MAG: tRNA (adenine-N(1)-)-methyltransferase catalytic subunit trm61 [Bogoriella megaspora]|nr:MAG: tRNA (adenine-N(1)-)-methyltransferase catalytic subunit trm61 [Bogoriella megaspora]